MPSKNLIVHQSHLPSLLPKIAEQLTEKGCRIFADDQAKSALGSIPSEPATDAEYAEEFLDLRLAIKTVSSVDEAIFFINRFGSGHSESILSSSKERAEKFPAGSGMHPQFTGTQAPVLPMGLNWIGCGNWHLDRSFTCQGSHGVGRVMLLQICD